MNGRTFSQILASEEKATTASLGQLVSLHGALFNNSITIVLCSDDARCSGQEASEANASHLPDHAALQTLQDALLHSLDRWPVPQRPSVQGLWEERTVATPPRCASRSGQHAAESPHKVCVCVCVCVCVLQRDSEREVWGWERGRCMWERDRECRGGVCILCLCECACLCVRGW